MTSPKRHQLELSIPEALIPGTQPHNIMCSISFKNKTFQEKIPTIRTVSFDIENLNESDALSLEFYENDTKVATLTFEMREQFIGQLEGDFDKWFKLKTLNGPETSSQQMRGSSPNRFSDMYEKEGTSGAAPRFGRARLNISLHQVVEIKAEEIEEKTTEQRMATLQSDGPCPLDECPRCGYLEKLTVTQQNDLLSNEAMQEAFRELRKTMMQQEEEELLLPSHLRMEYGHRHDAYSQSINPKTAELEIDLPYNFREGQGALNAQEAEHLRMVVLGLVEKLKGMQIIQGELKNTQVELRRSQKAREELQQSLDETMQQLTSQRNKQTSTHEKLLIDRNTAVDELRVQQQKYKETLAECNNVQNELAKIKASFKGTQAQGSLYSDMRAEIDQLLERLNDSEDQRRVLSDRINSQNSEFEFQCNEQKALADEHLKIIADLREQIAELKRRLAAEENNNEDSDRENTQLRGQIARLQGEIAIISDKESQLEEIMGLAKDHEIGRHTLQTSLNEAVETFNQKLQEIMDINHDLQETKTNIQGTLVEVENTLENKNEQLGDLNRENYEMSGNIASLEQLLCVREDMQQLVEDLQNQNTMYSSIKDQLMKELDFLTDYLLTQTEKTLAGHRIAKKMTGMVEDKKIEVECLRRIVQELQSVRPGYVAQRDDPIDSALAEYINTRERPLDVPFTREQNGSYLFGSKRVFIKIENGKIIIRVGGGFMQIDEFVEIYTPLELEKWEMKQMEHSVRHKQVLGKLASNVVENSGREDTKTRKRNISPAKAAKIIQKAFEGQGSNYSTFYAVPRKQQVSSPTARSVPRRSPSKNQI